MHRLLPLLLLTITIPLCAADYERFEENGKIGLRDNQGTVILPAKFDALGWSDGNFSLIGQITGYRQKGRWGLLNLKKEFITPAAYETITYPGADRVIVSKFINPYAVKFGCLDLQGKMVVPFAYDEISLHGMRAIVMVKNGVRFEYGLIDLNDRSILPLRYRKIVPIGSLRYAVMNFEDKNALCSEEGKWITDFSIDAISDFRFDLAVIHRNWRQGVIDRNGLIRIEPEYREIKIAGPDEIMVRTADTWAMVDAGQHDIWRIEADALVFAEQGYGHIELNGKAGLVDENFQTLWPLVYDYIGAVKNRQAVVRRDGKYNLLRLDQSAVLPAEFDSVCADGNFIRTRNMQAGKSSWDLYDTFGIKKTSSSYEWIAPFNGKFFPVKSHGYWGGVDRYGKENLACVYDSLLETRDQLVAVRFQDQTGIITLNDEWRLLPQKYPVSLLNGDCFLEQRDSLFMLKDFNDNLIYFTDNPVITFSDHLLEWLPDGTRKEVSFQGLTQNHEETALMPAEVVFRESEGFTGIRRDGKYGFVDQQGRLRIANRYEDIGIFHEGLAPVKLLGKWGFINTADQIVIQPTFDTTGSFDQGLATVSRHGKYGLMNTAGSILLELHYDSIRRIQGLYFLLMSDSRQGLADKNGRILIEPRFDHFEVIPGDRVIVSQGGRFGLLTTDGMSLFPLQYGKLVYLPEKNIFLAQQTEEWKRAEISK